MQLQYREKFHKNRFIYSILFLTICLYIPFPDKDALSIGALFMFVTIISISILQNRRIKITVHFLWMASFIIWTLLGALFAYNTEVAISDIVNVTLKLLFLTMLISVINDKKQVNILLKFLVSAGIILAIRILIQTPPDTWGSERIGIEVGINSNGLGFIFSYCSISSLYLAHELKRKKYYAAFALFVIFCLLTGSKTALLMIVVGSTLMLILYSKSILTSILITLFIPIFLFGIYITLMNVDIFYTVLGNRIEGFFSIFDSEGVVDASTDTRMSMINDAWSLFLQRPILGNGLENFRLLSVYDSYSHNNYMELLSNTGIIGTLIYYSLPVSLLITSILKRIRQRNKNYNLIIILLSIVIITDISSITYKKVITQIIVVLCFCYKQLLKKEHCNNSEVKSVQYSERRVNKEVYE